MGQRKRKEQKNFASGKHESFINNYRESSEMELAGEAVDGINSQMDSQIPFAPP